jgi:hypothetical protein
MSNTMPPKKKPTTKPKRKPTTTWAPAKPKPTTNIYQFRVTLLEIKPTIWRRGFDFCRQAMDFFRNCSPHGSLIPQYAASHT